MSSEKKAAASRINGRKSRGPRTAAGRERSSRNARLHGLSTIAFRNPACSEEIERIARDICGKDPGPLLFEQAVAFAESELILRCVSAERIAVIERLRIPGLQPIDKGDNSLALAEARFEQGKRAYEDLVKLYPQVAEKGLREFHVKMHEFVKQEPSENAASTGSIDSTDDPQPGVITGERDEFEAVRMAMPDLDRLARYERRARSRRKKALRRFVEIKAMA